MTIELLKSHTHAGKRRIAGDRLELPETDRGYLTEEELKLIANTVFVDKQTNLVRDMFLFGCFTFVALTNVCLIINKLQTNNKGIGNGLETTCLHHFA